MNASQTRRPLEPLAGVCALVILAHLVAVAGLVILDLDLAAPAVVPSSEKKPHVWYTPADFLMMRPGNDMPGPEETLPSSSPPTPPEARLTSAMPQTAKPTEASEGLTAAAGMVVPEANEAPAQVQKAYSKMIKLSPMHASGFVKEPPPRPIISLLDVAKLAEQEPNTQDSLLVELQSALMEAWELPKDLAQKRYAPVIVRLRILTDGSPTQTLLERSSDDTVLDRSVLDAVQRMKKISAAQAAKLPEEGYAVEATFQIE